MKFLIIFMALLLINPSLKSQTSKNKPENFFGIQVRTILPNRLVGDQAFVLNENEFESTITPLVGYSYGGIVRIGLTKLLAIETGINYTRRNYKVNYNLKSVGLIAKDEVGYVSCDIPINMLVYIKLSKHIYMNVGIGISTNFNASNISSEINPQGTHLFKIEGGRFDYFDFNTNADLGFEYRSLNSGTFYLGMSGRIPFSPTFEVAAAYRNGTNKTVTNGIIDGSAFSLNLKYFF
ncbi:outer membrane beta-barrel protein [Brumimicrobium oceani]|nr:outer membrane beta-barrel protein [Brumimicrobium oceani]